MPLYKVVCLETTIGVILIPKDIQMTIASIFRLSFLLFLVGAAIIHRSDANAKFINSTCTSADRADYCISMLNSDPRSKNACTVQQLTSIAFDITIADASATLSKINAIGDENSGTTLEEACNQCVQIYYNAIEDLKDAQKDVNSEEYSGASNVMDSVIDAPDNCQATFGDRSINSPVTEDNQRANDKIDICSRLVDLLDS